ncbi:b59 [miniopterid betaherpesvirus 1]|uniref:B59 n=1 Tax=miniopterid betaherpesvirus 1 TaxID=3070189 RepID=I3VQ48_9BETA|nr:b59 [miniopterid betaherpesvirus 1]AFK83892.1 b59 [miniopterid betaherpesvirus 1]
MVCWSATLRTRPIAVNAAKLAWARGMGGRGGDSDAVFGDMTCGHHYGGRSLESFTRGGVRGARTRRLWWVGARRPSCVIVLMETYAVDRTP